MFVTCPYHHRSMFDCCWPVVPGISGAWPVPELELNPDIDSESETGPETMTECEHEAEPEPVMKRNV